MCQNREFFGRFHKNQLSLYKYLVTSGYIAKVVINHTTRIFVYQIFDKFHTFNKRCVDFMTEKENIFL